MSGIKGDYQGRLKTIKATSDAKLETVAAIDAGTNIIGNIDRVATVGHVDGLGTVERVKDIDNLGTVGRLETIGMIEAGTISEVGHVGTVGDINHLGSIGNVNRIESLGSVNNIPYVWDVDLAGYYSLACESIGLQVSPGINSGTFKPLAVNPDGELQTAPATSRKGGVQTVNNKGTAIALLASSTPAIGVIVKAQHENLGTVYVGDSTVDNTHGFLLRRDEFVSFSCQNAGSVYIDASRGTQKVSYLYVNY